MHIDQKLSPKKNISRDLLTNPVCAPTTFAFFSCIVLARFHSLVHRLHPENKNWHLINVHDGDTEVGLPFLSTEGER